MQALIFDCDGVLVDSERDGHRVAFNEAFRNAGLEHDWSVEHYHELLQVAGGKERMGAHFEAVGWPVPERERDEFLARLHADKSRIFQERIAAGAMEPRPGVARLVDEARAAGVRLAVCSTSKLESVRGCVNLLGSDRASAFEFILAGDMVAKKKPNPEIYATAADRFDLPPNECIVIEDSAIGCAAAVGAGMRCVVTTSAYTAHDDFTGAYKVVSELGDGPGALKLKDIAAD